VGDKFSDEYVKRLTRVDDTRESVEGEPRVEGYQL
jgi:hypothetical protein